MIKNIQYIVIAVFISLFITLISVVIVNHYNKHIEFTHAEVNGAKALPLLKQIVFQTQKLSFTTLKNTPENTTDTKKLYLNIQQLKQLFDEFGFQDSFATAQSLEKKVLYISSLQERAQVHQHLQILLEDELQLIVSVANDSNLILDPKLTTYYLMDSVINTLMQTLFYLGEVEEFYTTKSISQERALALAANLKNATSALQRSLKYILEFNSQLTPLLQPKFSQLQQELTLLLRAMKQQHQVNTQEIQTIRQHIATIYETNNNLLTNLLQERLKNYIVQKDAMILSTIIYFLIIYLLLYTLFKNEKTAKENEHLAYFDQLTSLPNRYALDRDLKRTNPVSVQLIDIKKFSFINDFYGEEIGDTILIKVAQTIKNIAQKQGCHVYRVAADQFMSMNTSEDRTLCHKVAKAIFKYFNTTTLEIVTKDSNVITVSLKVRIAKVFINPMQEDDKFHARVKADIALNYAKKKHKDYITYDKNLQLEERIKEELEVVKTVQNAILQNNVIPVFQRITKDNGDTFEVLMRIRNKDDNTLIPPALFLHNVQNTPYYPQLTKIIIKKSFDYFQNTSYSFSLNFSFADITNKSTVAYLINMVEKYKMQNKLIIEILETESLHNITLVKHFIEKVRSYGIQIAIDDFGSGYSNFIYLAQLEPDYIKIDGSIIKNIDTDEKSFIIAKHISEFAKEIGCKTIAEFVHSKEVAQKLEELHIDGMQGYYIAKPLEDIKE